MAKEIDQFENQIINTESKSILKEVAETTLDAFMQDGLVKELPIVGTFASIAKIGSSIKEHFEIKKLAAFFENLSGVSDKDKKTFIAKIEKDDEGRKLFYERLIIVLQSFDDIDKARILANLFKLYMLEILSKHEFLRFAKILENLYLGDLLALFSVYSQVRGFGPGDQSYKTLFYDDIVQSNLETSGLIRKKTKEEVEEDTSPEGQSERVVTRMGTMLAFTMYYDDNDIERWKRLGMQL
jgi:hypothetical protein